MAKIDFSNVYTKDQILERLDGEIAELKEINRLGGEVMELINRNHAMISTINPLDKDKNDLWKLLLDDAAKLTILYSRLTDAYVKLYNR